ncbi:NAD(P)-dependent oxidoreductase [candidate division TA06 bacterium]|uniref:NAD(P)-dependent oxidoreductase n=1 Tax=candidate division TA06 bacterium TaxID=2250710 RepID=A0A933IBE6_UNCT6|nr:NAD(P)-dependent oxidoreductase [candidate division TA06 bacterium]
MKVLVTGATGFVGACLTRRLVAIGHDVHICLRPRSDRWRIKDLKPDIKEHLADLRDADVIMNAVSQIQPEVVFHLATHGGFAGQSESADILETNILGTVNLLRACEKTGFNCFINTGSSSEYGPKTEPMNENDPLYPVGDYGVSKAAATLYCRSEAVRKKLPILTLRLFSPYGQWDDPRRFIPYVIKSLLRGESPELASPNSVRDYIFIDDVIDLFLKAAAIPRPGGIFNVGSGQQHTTGDVVGMIAENIGQGAVLLWGKLDPPRLEPLRWEADTASVKKSYDWDPATPLAKGLVKTVEWFRTHLELYP